MSVSETLKNAIQKSDATLYRIAVDSEVYRGTLQRFLDCTRPHNRIDTVEKLCGYFGLELRPITRKHRIKS